MLQETTCRKLLRFAVNVASFGVVTVPDVTAVSLPVCSPPSDPPSIVQSLSSIRSRTTAVALLVLPFVFACASATPGAVIATPSATAAAAKPADASMAGHEHMTTPMSHAGMGMAMGTIVIPPGALYTKADVDFMQGMIAHHAQAIYMSRLADARGSNQRVIRFAKKIDQSQRAEIRLMQEWLVANKQMAPDTNSYRTMMMAGMLTPEQLAKLETTKGPEFDRQFLLLMIQHHQGALKMVKDLFATPRAGQDIDISVFANDVEVVQTAEIQLMHQMLADL